MGDVRFIAPYEQLRRAPDRRRAIQEMQDVDLIAALAATSQAGDDYLANVLATEAQNRVRQNANILGVAGEGLGAVDREGSIRFLNPAAEAVLGYPSGALLGKNFHDQIHRTDAWGRPLPRLECPIYRIVLGEGRTWHGENEVFTRADGTTFPVDYTASPLMRDGEVDGAVLVFRDMTAPRRAREALKESEERYRSLMEYHVDAIFAFDLKGRFLEANPVLERMSGYSLDDLHRLTFEPLVAAEDLERTRHHFRLAAMGEPQRYDSTLLCKDGSRKRVHVTNVPIRVQGSIVGVYGIAKDITERVRDEERLRHFASLLEALNETSLDGVVIVDPHGRFLYRNRRFGEMWGFPEEILESGDDNAALAYAEALVESPPSFADSVRRIYAESPPAARSIVRLRDGRVFDRHGAAVRDREGTPLGWVWTFRDVTAETKQRAAYEAALRQSEERYHQLYDNVPSMYFLLDLDGRILSANRFGAEYLGYKAEELVGRPVVDLAHPDDRPVVLQNLRSFPGRTDSPVRSEFRKLTRKGEVLWVRETLRLMRDPSGVDVLLNVCEDVSQHKRWEATFSRVWSEERREETAGD